MENFADYMLEEKDLIAKMEIEYYLAKKENLFFDKTVVFKAELARLFMNYMEIDVDKNLVLTAVLLCNCKKEDNPQVLGKLKTYAQEGAEYLRSIGFNEKICTICEQVNRYSGSKPRSKESDILELVDNYGGMLLNRKERIGFQPDEALVLLEHRNLKDKYNRYLETFIMFAEEIEKVKLGDNIKIGAMSKLDKIYNQSKDEKELIRKIAYDFQPEVDEKIDSERKTDMFRNIKNPNRPLFSKETTQKIMGHILNTEEKGSKVDED